MRGFVATQLRGKIVTWSDRTKAFVAETLSEYFGSELLEDGAQSLTLRDETALLFANFDEDFPRLRIMLPLVVGANHSLKLLERINQLNHVPVVKVTLDDDIVSLCTEVFAEDITKERILRACVVLLVNAEDIGSGLVEEFGGTLLPVARPSSDHGP
jgi:hypothetical protein